MKRMPWEQKSTRQSFIIQREDTGEYYKHRQYGNRWVKDPYKAKLYRRRSDVSNAITLMREAYSYLTKVPMIVHEYELVDTHIRYLKP